VILIPEAPEVESMVRVLSEDLKPPFVLTLLSYDPAIMQKIPPHISSSGSLGVVRRISRLSKFIVLKTQDYVVTLHPAFTGVLLPSFWDKYPDGHRVKFERTALSGCDHSTLYWHDRRRFSKVWIQSRRDYDEDPYWKSFGPDVLSEVIDASFASRVKEKIGSSKRTIRDLLLDQHVISGIGNIYVAEILYESRIHPDSKMLDITSDQFLTLLETAHKIMNSSLDVGGTSVWTYLNSRLEKGQYQKNLKVFKQSKCPLGHEVVREKKGSRGSYYCPTCQKKGGTND